MQGTNDNHQVRAVSSWPAMHFEARRAVDELRSLTPADPALLLQSAVERFGRRVALATALGPGSLALLDMVRRAEIPLRVFVLDTGLLFDETYGLWAEIEQRYGIALEAVKPDPANAEADRLWQTNPDSCCRRRKVEPLRRLLAGMDAWVTGIRRDQGDARAESQQVEWDPQFGVIKLNPLALWSRSEVDAYVERHNVPVNPLVARGYRSIGCWPCTAPVAPEALERAGRWTGSAKTECGIHSRPPVAPRARRS